MDQATRDSIRFCAFCPDVCRILYPAGPLPKESNMCSALAYLAHAVLSGNVAYTPDVAGQLASLEGAEVCKTACPYNIDVPVLLSKVRAEYASGK